MSDLVSVIIATHNRSGHLKGTLESVLKQNTENRFDFEVLVVDNNSTDATQSVVESCRAAGGQRLKYLFESRQGKSFALNRGIEESQGNILVMTDDDVVADPNWLSALVECFQKHSCDVIGGRVLPTFPAETPAWVRDNPVQMAGVVVLLDYGQGVMPFAESMNRFIGANFAFKREVFESCGVFRTDLGPGQGTVGEDTEFSYRVIRKNKNLYYCGQAVVWHPVDLKRLALKNIVNWHMALGRFNARCDIEEGKQYAAFAGVPQYLIRGISGDILKFFVNIFSQKIFFNWARNFFRKLGMILEYRANYVRTRSEK